MSPGPLTDQVSRLAAGELTSEHLTAEAIRRAQATQDGVNAFRLVRGEAALEEARAADRRLAAGERLPLLGVPVAIKDDSDLAGETTPFGCAGRFEVRGADGEAVRRLRAAGAVVVGKTRTPELGLYPWTEGPAFEPTRNPWNTDYTPGGSSGGSAAAVSAGIVAGALGSDGAGSVRIPASWSNLVGIKPRRGRVSSFPDREAFYGVTCIGPLALTVRDAALLLDVVSGSHPADRHRAPAPARSFLDSATQTPPRVRVALALRPPFVFHRVDLDAEVAAAVRGVAESLAGLGHTVEEANPPFDAMGPPFLVLASAGVADWYRRIPDTGVVDRRTRDSARSGRVLRPLARPARASQGPLSRLARRFFDRYDVLISPVTASRPLPIGAALDLGQWGTDRLMAASCPYTWPWNFLGWPAMSVPAGFVGGLPVGAQLAGPPASEDLLLSIGAELEAVLPSAGLTAPTGW